MNALFNLGIHDQLSLNDVKKVRLTNVFILSYYGVILVSIITDYFFAENFTVNLSIHSFQLLLLAFIQLLLQKRKAELAKSILTFWLLISCFIFSNFAEPNQFMEFFYLLGVCFGMMILNNKIIQRIVLVTAVCFMVIPILYFGYYSEPIQMSPLSMPVSMCWVLFYLVVVYFKNNNVRNEKELLEQKKVVDEQRRKLQEINNFQKQFFINVAHEIRTPLTLINGHANRVKDEENKSIIQQQSEKIKNIIDDVLDLAKLETDTFKLNKKQVNLNKLLVKIITSFEFNFNQKGIQLNFTPNSDFVFIQADNIFLERAINNILSNALKYTSKGGSVSVIMKTDSESVIISFIDSGIGIKIDEFENIFDRFYQVDNSMNKAGGSGIGLAFTKEIVGLHKGNIEIESTEGIGSTFKISLPIDSIEENVEELTYSNQRKGNIAPKIENSSDLKHQILLVEDNHDMIDFIQSILVEYQVVAVKNGQEGIQELIKQSFDFIITDYMMPVMNGYDFVKQLRAIGYDTPVLMLTAKNNEETKIESFRIGIDDFMGKPFNEEELLIKIRNNIKNNQSRKSFIEEEQITVESTEIPFLTKVTDFIYENCAEPSFGVDQICKEFALSTSSLYRKLKSLTGLSAKAIITEVRLKKAKQNLQSNPNYSVVELAESVGYTNYSHFKKLFINRYGENSLDNN